MRVLPYKQCPYCDGELEIISYTDDPSRIEEERHFCGHCELKWNQILHHYYFEKTDVGLYHITRAEMRNDNCYDEWRIWAVNFRLSGLKVDICYNYMQWEYGVRILDTSVGDWGKELTRMKTFIPDYKNLEPLKQKLKIWNTFS